MAFAIPVLFKAPSSTKKAEHKYPRCLIFQEGNERIATICLMGKIRKKSSLSRKIFERIDFYF